VYNTSAHIAQFWDGRAATLEEQAKGPIINRLEMAMPGGEAVVQALAPIAEYRRRFRRAFPTGKLITFDKVAHALASFERQLVTPGRFDRFVRGERDALTPTEERGMARFVSLGCATCHNGAAVGGGAFQRLGLSQPYPNQRDLGRFAVTKRDEDRMVFRVPSLRNIGETGPYFHDGSVATLDDAVRAMALYQLGLHLDATDVSDIVSFLGALTGELPANAIAPPRLPGA
jgi:cytochrome c peroxidase